jgi:ribosomal protein S18 acetylase RimI-like enzyme
MPRNDPKNDIVTVMKPRSRELELNWSRSQEGIDWEALSDLYRAAPLGDKRPEELKEAFDGSRFKCFVFDAGRLVGAGRALADGVDCSYLCDVAVLPEYQGNGIGGGIVAELVKQSRGHKKILLYARPGKEGFYKKLGFLRMSTAMAIFENQQQALEWGLVDET